MRGRFLTCYDLATAPHKILGRARATSHGEPAHIELQMGSSRNSKIDCGRCSGFELNVTCRTSQSSLNGRAETEITHPWCSLLLDNLHLSRTAVPVGVTDVARVRRVRPVCRAEGFTDHESRPTCVIANARTPHTMQFQGSCSVEIRLQPTACKVHRRGLATCIPSSLFMFPSCRTSFGH